MKPTRRRQQHCWNFRLSGGCRRLCRARLPVDHRLHLDRTTAAARHGCQQPQGMGAWRQRRCCGQQRPYRHLV